jgi:hypothetical protein
MSQHGDDELTSSRVDPIGGAVNAPAVDAGTLETIVLHAVGKGAKRPEGES